MGSFEEINDSNIDELTAIPSFEHIFDMEKFAQSAMRVILRDSDDARMVRASAKHILFRTVAAFQPPR